MSRSDQIAFATVSIVTFVIGAILSYVFFCHSSQSVSDVAASMKAAMAAKSTAPDYMPAAVLCAITICFTGGIGYVIANQVYNDNAAASKAGIQNAVGLAWGLFIIAAVLIPASLSSGKVSPDSKFYLVATLFTFFFSTLIAIIVFFNKLHNLPTSVDQLDLTTTRNMQMGLFVGTVAYGIAGLTGM